MRAPMQREALFQALLTKAGQASREAGEESQEEQLGYLQRGTNLWALMIPLIIETARQRMLPLAVWLCLGMEQFVEERQVAPNTQIMWIFVERAMTFAEAAMDMRQAVAALRVERAE